MKKTQIDRAIEALESEKRVLDLAIAKLREQAAKKPIRRVKKPEIVQALPMERAK